MWLPPALKFSSRAPILRSGIPLVAPWFGPSPEGLHGWVRIKEWDLVEVAQRSDGAVTTTWRLGPDASSNDPQASLEFLLEASFGEKLHTVLKARNVGDHPLHLELALHAYWDVSAQEIRVDNLDHGGVDRLTGNSPVSDGVFEELHGQTVDRFYPCERPILVHDDARRRVIEISSANSAKCVVWNPGVSGCAANTDMADDDWQRFICIEATRVRDDELRLLPGQSAELALAVAVTHI